MGWSWRVGSVAGTDITIHGSFLLLLVFLWTNRQPQTLRDVVSLVLLIVVLFGSVLLHEIGHTVAARRYGIAVPQIVLWPLGGLAMLQREPARHRQRIVITAAGPLVNIALAALGFVSFRSLIDFEPTTTAWRQGILDPFVLTELFTNINLGLAVFNLLPAYPLDGGRIVRSLLSIVIGERIAARMTLILTAIIASGLLVFGILQGDVLLALTAVMVFFAAATLIPGMEDRINRGWLYLTDRAYWHLLRDEPEPAIVLLDRVLARQPTNARAMHNRAWAHMMRSDYIRAINDYDRTITLTPDEPKPYADRGMAAYMAFRFEEALEYISRAHALGLDTSWLWMRQAIAHRALRQYEAALSDLNRAVTLAPDGWEGYAARALVRLRLGDPKEALEDINQSITLQSERAGLLLYRSQILWAMGDYERATQDSTHALANDPKVALVHDELSLLLLWHGQLPWALDHYDRAAASGLDPERIAVGRGDAFRINGEHVQAIAAYNQALEYKDDPSTVLSRGQSYQALGDTSKARADFEAVLTRSEHPSTRRLAEEGLRGSMVSTDTWTNVPVDHAVSGS